MLGLEAVLPNGEVWNGLKRLRKDNTGYDLKQLLIGAEGTLGVVTAAALKLFPVMASRAVAMIGVESPEAALKLLVRAKDETGGAVEAFELMGRLGVELRAEEHRRHARPAGARRTPGTCWPSSPPASRARPRRRWSGSWRRAWRTA